MFHSLSKDSGLRGILNNLYISELNAAILDFGGWGWGGVYSDLPYPSSKQSASQSLFMCRRRLFLVFEVFNLGFCHWSRCLPKRLEFLPISDQIRLSQTSELILNYWKSFFEVITFPFLNQQLPSAVLVPINTFRVRL
nr:PREDICTED: uncharacterized protein LOC107398532 [Tribolium castaneum]|eukprot:XP_015838351.1 PREDICTED: uncharacterized protein LOC107398532 [Tribolium castaneum]